MAQRGDCVHYVGKYSLGNDGFFTGSLDDDEDTVDIVQAMQGENEIKSKELQDIFYFVKNTVTRLVGACNISIKQEINLHINGNMHTLIKIMKDWQTAHGKTAKLPRQQAWKYLPRMVRDGTIPSEGEFSFRYRPFRFANKENNKRCKLAKQQGEEVVSSAAGVGGGDAELAAPPAQLTGAGAATAAEEDQQEAMPAQEADEGHGEQEVMVPASFDYGIYPPTPAANPIPFYPSRLKDLELEQLKDAFEQIGTSKIPKKPLKKHYLNALRKDVRKIINSMPLDEQKEWLQRADIECDGYDAKHLGPMILGRVM